MKSLTTQDLVAGLKKHPVGFATALLVLLLGGAIYFRGGLVPELQATMEEKSALGQRQQANIRFASQLDEQLARLEAALVEINVRAINPAALANNLQYFYRMEAEHGFKILDLRQGTLPALPATRPNYVRVPFTLAVEGAYPAVLALLRDVERGRHFARVEIATLSPAPGQDRRTVVTLNLSLELLARP
jgi:hypothetical protein